MSPGRRAAPDPPLTLRLFVAGGAPNSLSAIRCLRSLLEAYPRHKTVLEIVDVLERPELGLAAGVLVTPTLIKVAPGPERRIIGSLKDTEALLAALGLPEPESK
jgi:circadian clock protein KaiB